MEKTTVLQRAAVGATVVISAVVKIFAPQPTDIFGFAQPQSTPIIKMPDSTDVAAHKASAIKDLINSEAFLKALPSTQKQMLTSVKEIFN